MPVAARSLLDSTRSLWAGIMSIILTRYLSKIASASPLLTS